MTVSATTKTARDLAVPAGGDRGAALGLGRRPRAGELGRRVGSAQSASSAGRPATTARPSTMPSTPSPSWLAKPVGRRQRAELARVAAAAIARAIGCSEAFSSAPTSRSASASVDARRRRRPRAALIRPVVTVPVLSRTIVSTRRVDSRTSGPLISSPSWAPRPVPTSSAVGVASPSAQGQAMISTATAAVNA